jgi:hypothetical protein
MVKAWLLVIIVHLHNGVSLPAYKTVRSPAHCLTLLGEAVVAARGDGVKISFFCRPVRIRARGL